MAFYILAGYPCFQGGSDYLIFTKALALDYKFPLHFSEMAKEFIGLCLKLNPDDRPSIDQLKEHGFIKDAPSVYPIKSLKETALDTIKEYFVSKNSEETFKQEFPALLSKFECPELENLYSRLLYHYSKETSGHMNQGV